MVKVIDVFPEDAQDAAWKVDAGPAPGQYSKLLNGYKLTIQGSKGGKGAVVSHRSLLPFSGILSSMSIRPEQAYPFFLISFFLCSGLEACCRFVSAMTAAEAA